jgi:phage tail-like protein
MARFTVNPERFDPYKNFKFRVKWDGKYVAGVSRVSGLVRKTEVVTTREGGDPSGVRQMPGLTAFEPIVLLRGVTHDAEFEKWSNKVWKYGMGLGAESSLKDFRKDVYIELLNEAGQLAMAFKVFRCWPSEYSALGELDSSRSTVAFESLTLQCEGWERDEDVVEPTEPSID